MSKKGYQTELEKLLGDFNTACDGLKNVAFLNDLDEADVQYAQSFVAKRTAALKKELSHKREVFEVKLPSVG